MLDIRHGFLSPRYKSYLPPLKTAAEKSQLHRSGPTIKTLVDTNTEDGLLTFM